MIPLLQHQVSRLLPAAAVLLGVSLSTQAGPAVRVPRAAPVVIDGRMDQSEWDGSALQRLTDGGELRLRHDGRSLFLGITSPRQSFASVCVARTDSIRILHASAALGSVAYGHAADEWHTGDSAFVYGMRNPALTEAASRERADYLSRHGWVASTFPMGGGRVQEMQITLDRHAGIPALALALFVPQGDSGTVVSWPGTLAPTDGCAEPLLVRGYVPPRLRFVPAGWARIDLQP
jgi:hypothetical protein